MLLPDGPCPYLALIVGLLFAVRDSSLSLSLSLSEQGGSTDVLPPARRGNRQPEKIQLEKASLVS